MSKAVVLNDEGEEVFTIESNQLGDKMSMARWAGVSPDRDDPLYSKGVDCEKPSGLNAGVIIKLPISAPHEVMDELISHIKSVVRPYIDTL